MARLLSDSFELTGTSSFYNWDTVVGPPFISTISPIDGLRSLRNTTGAGYIGKNVSTTELFVGFYWQPDAAFVSDTQPVIAFYGASGILGALHVSILGSAYVKVGAATVATGPSIVIASTTYHIQVRYKLDNAVGAIQVKLNDISVPYEIDFSGDTNPGVDAAITQVRLYGIDGSRIDNVIINDTSGAADNTWPGIVKFATLTAIGNGNYSGGWLKNSGSAADYTYVDENPNDGDTTYLYTTVTNTYASFSMSDQSLTNVTYKALLTHAIARKDGGTAKLAVGIRDNENNVNYVSGLKDLGVSYGVVTERRTTDPSTGTTWTSGGINATEALIISTA